MCGYTIYLASRDQHLVSEIENVIAAIGSDIFPAPVERHGAPPAPSFGIWAEISPLPTCDRSCLGVKISRESDSPDAWGQVHQLADGLTASSLLEDRVSRSLTNARTT